jgi:hypothetical protein
VCGVLRLHREETYNLKIGASPEDIVKAEASRRTFWVIQNHDNLYTQQNLPVSFAKSDITTLLPSSEHEFAFGRRPALRAALSGTRAGQRSSTLVSLPSRSLFATLIQAHDLWGTIVRDTNFDDISEIGRALCPWNSNSRYRLIAQELKDWEDSMPNEHRWSAWNLRGFKAEMLDLVSPPAL